MYKNCCQVKWLPKIGKGRKRERYEFFLPSQIKNQFQVDQRLKYERQALEHLEDNIGEYFYNTVQDKEQFLKK